MSIFDTNRAESEYNDSRYRGPLGELITPGAKIYLGTKMEKREYISKAEIAETEQEFLNLGFSKYKMPNNKEMVFFSNFKGDRIVYDEKNKQVIDRNINDPDIYEE